MDNLIGLNLISLRQGLLLLAVRFAVSVPLGRMPHRLVRFLLHTEIHFGNFGKFVLWPIRFQPSFILLSGCCHYSTQQGHQYVPYARQECILVQQVKLFGFDIRMQLNVVFIIWSFFFFWTTFETWFESDLMFQELIILQLACYVFLANTHLSLVVFLFKYFFLVVISLCKRTLTDYDALRCN